MNTFLNGGAAEAGPESRHQKWLAMLAKSGDKPGFHRAQDFRNFEHFEPGDRVRPVEDLRHSNELFRSHKSYKVVSVLAPRVEEDLTRHHQLLVLETPDGHLVTSLNGVKDHWPHLVLGNLFTKCT